MPVAMAIAGYLFIAYCAWKLCKTAGDADRQAEKDEVHTNLKQERRDGH